MGLGWELMQLIIEWAKADGLSVIEGQVLRENTVMLDMASALGFEIRSDSERPRSAHRDAPARRCPLSATRRAFPLSWRRLLARQPINFPRSFFAD